MEALKAILMSSTSRRADGKHAGMTVVKVALVVAADTRIETTRTTQSSDPTRIPPDTVVEDDTHRWRASAVQGTDAEVDRRQNCARRHLRLRTGNVATPGPEADAATVRRSPLNNMEKAGSGAARPDAREANQAGQGRGRGQGQEGQPGNISPRANTCCLAHC